MSSRLVVVLVGLLSGACGGMVASKDQLLRRAGSDLACAESALQVSEIDKQTRQVTGCGQRAVYVMSCVGYRCTWLLNADTAPVAAPAAAAGDAPPEDAAIEEERASDGSKTLKLYLRGDSWLIYVRAAPRTDIERASLVWRALEGNHRQCEIKLVANGMLVELGAETRRVAHKRSTDYRNTLPYASLLNMARSRRIVGQLCETEMMLSQTQLEKLRELVIRIHEAQVLSGDPKDQSPPSDPASDPSLL